MYDWNCFFCLEALPMNSRKFFTLIVLAVIVVNSAFCRGFSSFAGTRRALVVCIGDYPPQSGWNRLSSGNDKDIILSMLDRCGFRKDNVICLTDADATYSGIIGKLADLEKSCEPGDRIYIHFSCHGQEITDLDGDESLSDPNDRYDEAIVPYDACIAYNWKGYTGERHLTDDVLNRIFHRIADRIGKNGCLLVVNDACHSGGIERDEEPDSLPPFRGALGAFELPAEGRSGNPELREVTWISINACKSFQTNWECTVDGKMYGRLSYAMSKCFRNGITPDLLAEALKAEYGVLPMPKGKFQSIQMVIPDKLKRKKMFADE